MVNKRLSLFQMPREKGGKPMSKEKRLSLLHLLQQTRNNPTNLMLL